MNALVVTQVSCRPKADAQKLPRLQLPLAYTDCVLVIASLHGLYTETWWEMAKQHLRREGQ